MHRKPLTNNFKKLFNIFIYLFTCPQCSQTCVASFNGTNKGACGWLCLRRLDIVRSVEIFLLLASTINLLLEELFWWSKLEEDSSFKNKLNNLINYP